MAYKDLQDFTSIHREWPDDIEMPEDIKELIDRRWKDYETQ
jgi:hypothetical protein